MVTRMMTGPVGLILLLATLLAGCASTSGSGSRQDPSPPTVLTDFDPAANFDAYRSYAWIPASEANTGIKNPRIREAVQQAIVRQLGNRGLSQVQANQSPDLTIRYTGGGAEMPTISGPGVAMRGSARAPLVGGYGSSTIIQGALIVDLIDAKTGKLAWRAYIGDADVDRDEVVEDILNAGLDAAFKRYPPTAQDRERKRQSTN